MALYTNCDLSTAMGFSSDHKLEGEKLKEVCGLHHTWDSEKKKCVPDDEAMKGLCGPLSTWDAEAGKCVADTKKACGTHASFDDALGMCVMQASACGQGTVLLDGVCVAVSSGDAGGDETVEAGGDETAVDETVVDETVVDETV